MPSIQVTVLGSRGNVRPSAPRHARHSGVLVAEELLLDVGEKAFLRYRPRWILITHLHVDHAFFVERPLPEPLPVYAPEPHRHCRTEIVRPGRPFALGQWTITPIPTIHSHQVSSLAYRVERYGRSLLYTGDLVAIDSKYHRLLRNLDLVITEGSFIHRGGLVRKALATGKAFGHAGIPDLMAFFSKFTGRVVITHLGSWFYRDPAAARRRILELGEKHGVQSRVAWDGLRLSV